MPNRWLKQENKLALLGEQKKSCLSSSHNYYVKIDISFSIHSSSYLETNKQHHILIFGLRKYCHRSSLNHHFFPYDARISIFINVLHRETQHLIHRMVKANLADTFVIKIHLIRPRTTVKLEMKDFVNQIKHFTLSSMWSALLFS